jgi:putative lipase involved disintegration of autophagic bodies
MPWKAGTFFLNLLTSLSYQRTNALRSCHLGNIIEYDTVTNLSWSVDLRTHAIAQVVERILSEPWAAAEELGREVPPLKRQDDCVVRFWV